jgi:hypothetical protein
MRDTCCFNVDISQAVLGDSVENAGVLWRTVASKVGERRSDGVAD